MTLENLERQLQSLEKGSRFILRDDLYDLTELEQILEKAAARKLKIALLDTGMIPPEKFEPLTRYRFSLYTSVSVRTDWQEFRRLSLLLRPRNCRLLCWLGGDLKDEAPILSEVDIFDAIIASNRERKPVFNQLLRLAEEASRADTCFVYYHHGNMEENLIELGLKNCYLHVSNRDFEEEAEIMLLDWLKEFKKKGGRLLVHVDRVQSFRFLKLLSRNGAFLIFNLPPLEPDSQLYGLLTAWKKKKISELAYYLYKEVMA